MMELDLVEKEALMMYHSRKGQEDSQNLWPMVTMAMVLRAGSERPILTAYIRLLDLDYVIRILKVFCAGK
nr:hypothetical protein CFP56_19836 [Quercus suber]